MQSGLDSLAAVELRSAVSEKFSLSLPTTVVFDYPTPVALATYVVAQLAERHRPLIAQHVSPSAFELATSGVEAHDSRTVGIASVACRYPGHRAEGTVQQCMHTLLFLHYQQAVNLQQDARFGDDFVSQEAVRSGSSRAAALICRRPHRRNDGMSSCIMHCQAPK